MGGQDFLSYRHSTLYLPGMSSVNEFLSVILTGLLATIIRCFRIFPAHPARHSGRILPTASCG
ncbi:hypothetical protein NBRC116585_11650 [Thalassolituus maritimus]|uniref:Uncharacterized protein n=1 Tax=Thalassolituus maritimus TaxID=484498 RepID=A0ABP9ZY22_9GAMM